MTEPRKGTRRKLTRLVTVTSVAAVAGAAFAIPASLQASGHATTHSGRAFLAAKYTRTAPRSTTYVQLTEDGSSLFYPLYGAWAAAYGESHRGFSSTSGADGSGTGISDAETGTTDFGASDAYLPPTAFAQYPTIENIPMAISAQMINYNLGAAFDARYHLKLDGAVIAEMYEGKITNWDAKAIAKLNKGVKLPHLKVVPIHRSDASGDSFLFTSYLAHSDPSSFAGRQGPSVYPTWPNVSTAQSAKGNSGMAEACDAAKGCIAYIGISYKSDILHYHLGISMLKNRKGNFELPTSTTIAAEAAAFPKVPTNGAISLIFGPAKTGYPIINYEYIVLKYKQTSHQVAIEMKNFLSWCVNPRGGQVSAFLKPVNFQPLSKAAYNVSKRLISKIRS